MANVTAAAAPPMTSMRRPLRSAPRPASAKMRSGARSTHALWFLRSLGLSAWSIVPSGAPLAKEQRIVARLVHLSHVIVPGQEAFSFRVVAAADE